MPEQKDYLHACLELYSDLTEILYGRRQDIKRIENATAKVRSSPPAYIRRHREDFGPRRLECRLV